MFPVIISIVILLLAVKTNSQNYKLSDRCFKDGQTYPTSHPNSYSICFQSNSNYYEYEMKCRTLQYYNKNAQKCSRIPGGGSGVTHHETQICPGNFIGLLSYQNQPEFYHVCGYGPHFVAQCIGGKIFDDSCQKCIPKKESVTIQIWDNAGTNVVVPKCEKLGTFSIENHSELYYKCFAGSYPIFYQEVFKCGANATFDIQRKKCITKQAPCYQKGCFGVASNCTRYYNCKKLSNGTFRRRNYVCPTGKAFDALKRCCVPKNVAICLGHLVVTTQQSIYDNEQVGNAAAYPEEIIRAPLYTEKSTLSTKQDILSTEEIKITTLVAENTETTTLPNKEPETPTPTTEETVKMIAAIEDSTQIAEITASASKEPEETTLVAENTETTTLATEDTETPTITTEETVKMNAAIEDSTLIAKITTRASKESEITTLITESTETPTLATEENVKIITATEDSTQIAEITTNASEKPEETTLITKITTGETQMPILAPKETEKITPAIEETTPIAEETEITTRASEGPKETTVSIGKTEKYTVASVETLFNLSTENSTQDTETNSVKIEISTLASEDTIFSSKEFTDAEATEKTTLSTEETKMTILPIQVNITEEIENTTVYPEETLDPEIENVKDANPDNSKKDKHTFPNKNLEATIILIPEIKTQQNSLLNKPKNNKDDPKIISKLILDK